MIEFDRDALVDLNLHPHAHIVLGRQQVIDDVEAALAARPIDRGDVDDIPEQTARIVAQEAHDRDDVGRLRLNVQLVMGDGITLDRSRQRVGYGPAEGVESFIHRQRSIVEVRRIFFCRSSTP